ncbi:MAG: DinB family protein [Spirochaetia bacterium]|nr:DinB family protein [Spirochaetia bacterium]
MISESINENLKTGAEIADRIEALSEYICQEFQNIPTEEFFTSPEGAWSPALNLKHLIKAALPISITLSLPVVSLLPMGKSGSERNYAQVRDLYLSFLKNGAQAGVFTPMKISSGTEAAKTALIEKFKNTHTKFASRIRSWSERDLLRYRMPHPIIGMISVKEMLYFATYHLGHHSGNALRRRSPGLKHGNGN